MSLTLTQELSLGSTLGLMTLTECSALGSGSLSLGAGVINNTAGQTMNGAPMMRLCFQNKMAAGADANTSFDLWFLKSVDNGTTYEEGASGTTTPTRSPDFSIPAPTDTNPHLMQFDIAAPVGDFKCLLRNNGTGQATATATANRTTGTEIWLAGITSTFVQTA